MGIVLRIVSGAIPKVNVAAIPPIPPPLSSVILDSSLDSLDDSNVDTLEDDSLSPPPVYTKTIIAYNYVVSEAAIGNRYKIGLAVLHNDGTYHRDHPTIIQNGPSAGWNSNHAKDPYLIKVGTRIYCFYAASSTAVYNYGIGVSYSDDNGNTWTEYSGNPVLTQTQAWETAIGNSSVQFPTILYEATEADPNKKWKMWYAGDDLGHAIGYAYSPDGLVWTKFAGNPVLNKGAAGQWDDSAAFVPRGIIKIGATYYLFYGASDGTNFAVGYATFANPEGAYAKSGDNPILSPDGVTTTITTNVLVNDTNIEVANSAVFSIGHPVWVYDATPKYYLTKVVSKPDGTHVIVEDPAPITIAAATGLVRSVAYNGAGPAFVEYDGATFRLYASAFIPLLLPAGGLKEVTLLVSGAALNALSIDYLNSPIVRYNLWERMEWEHISLENPSKVSFTL